MIGDILNVHDRFTIVTRLTVDNVTIGYPNEVKRSGVVKNNIHACGACYIDAITRWRYRTIVLMGRSGLAAHINAVQARPTKGTDENR